MIRWRRDDDAHDEEDEPYLIETTTGKAGHGRKGKAGRERAEWRLTAESYGGEKLVE